VTRAVLYESSMAPKIWLRVNLPEKEVKELQRSFPECELREREDSEADSQWLADVQGVFTEDPLPDSLVQEMPKLRWLHVTRGGVSAYLTPAVKERPIQVTGSKGIHGAVFSEFALACILALAKKLPQCMAAQRHKQWQRLQPVEIEGQTLGIIGLGVAGSALARKAKAFDMRVIATKRTVVDKPAYVDEFGGPELLPQLLSQSDFVVLLLASVPSTFNIIGESELRTMKKSAYLINLSGGRTIEEHLLVRALKENWIAGAALDAFARQPLPQDSELWHLPNVIITPRIAGIASQKWPALLPIFQDNLRRFVSGEPLRNLVDKELGY
jgi:phosphoglycerate dehydrogenase-like enzyme